MPLGSETRASTASRSGPHRPLLLELARQRLDRVLADLDRAARAERPAPGPGRHPGRAAAGQPAAGGVARHAEHRQRGGRVLAQPHRPPHRLQLEPQGVRVGLERAQPRCQAVVVRRRAAILELGDRAVGVRALVGVGLERVLSQRTLTWRLLPGPTREDAGREGHLKRGGYPSAGAQPRRLRQEHAGRLQGQGGPRQELPVGRQGQPGPPVVVRPRADRLGGGRRDLRPDRGRRRQGRDRDDARDLRRRARRRARSPRRRSWRPSASASW